MDFEQFSKSHVNVFSFSEQILNLKCKMLDGQFCIHVGESPVIIMNQLKSIYNSPSKDSHSHRF